MSLPRVGLEERGTPMLDARTARILAEENEKGYEARWRREMVERCEKNIEKAVNEGRLHAVLFVGGLDDAKREALKVMRERGFEIGEEVWGLPPVTSRSNGSPCKPGWKAPSGTRPRCSWAAAMSLGTKSPSRPADCGLSSSDTAGAFLMMPGGADTPRPCSRM